MMDGSGATAWWVAAGLLVVAELAVGSFNLLMLALGMAAGALAAHAGLALPGQMVAAALVGGGAVVAWRAKRPRDPRPGPAASDPAVNLDIGSRVHVARWHADGSARVHYRGTLWDARYRGDGPPAPGEYTVRALDGNCLVLDR